MKKVILLCILTLLAGTPCTAASEELSDIRERLKWLNAEAIMLAVEDMKGQPGFDYQGVVEKWKYMSRHLERVRKQLNGKDSLATRKEAEHLLSLQREILLSNPLLNADRILVIRGGKITESGTHRELLNLHGYYYDLYTTQFREEAANEILS